MQLEESKVIKNFLSYYETKESTKKNKMGTLQKFFKIILVDPDAYFVDGRPYRQNVEKFWKSMMAEHKHKHLTPLSIRMHLSNIKMFLMRNEIELPTIFWRDLKNNIQGSRKATQDVVPEPKQLREIMAHAGTKEMAMFLISSSTGMRVEELTLLKIEDIDLDADPVMISIRGETTKSGNPRVTFISNEAKEALQKWLKVRDDYIAHVRGKTKGLHNKKKEYSSEIFPFTTGTARDWWNLLLKKANYDQRDPQTGHRLMHLHTLRAYFRTNLVAGGVALDITEALMGHEGYLTKVYRRFSPRQLGEFYKKGVWALQVFEGGGDPKEKRDLQKANEAKDSLINLQAEEIKRISSEKAQITAQELEEMREIIRERRENGRLSPEKVQTDSPGDEEKLIKMLSHPKVREVIFQIREKEYDRLKRNKNQRRLALG